METTITTHDMKKAGRKPLPEHKKRNHFVGIKLSKAELKQFEALANSMNKSISETVRHAVAEASA